MPLDQLQALALQKPDQFRILVDGLTLWSQASLSIEGMVVSYADMAAAIRDAIQGGTVQSLALK